MNDQMQGQQQVQLTLADISTVVNVIDAVSRRGGFEGQELAGVGTLRNKLVAYVNQRAPQPPEGAMAAEADIETPAEPLTGELADKVQ